MWSKNISVYRRIIREPIYHYFEKKNLKIFHKFWTSKFRNPIILTVLPRAKLTMCYWPYESTSKSKNLKRWFKNISVYERTVEESIYHILKQKKIWNFFTKFWTSKFRNPILWTALSRPKNQFSSTFECQKIFLRCSDAL